MIGIKKVNSKSDLKCFIGLPDKLYENDPNYVREPNMIQKFILSSNKNPFFRHSKVELYLAYKSDKPAGRIALIRNNVHINYHNEDYGFFGFFEVINDYEAAKALFDKAVQWVKKENLNGLIGPENFTTNDSCGMLYSGFDTPPIVMMPYNKEYYNHFLNMYGFTKTMDLYSYSLSYNNILSTSSINELLNFYSEKLNSSNIKIRCVDFKKIDREIIQMRQVYNEANKNNWGFIPLSEEEFRETAHMFRLFVPEKLFLLAEKDGKQVGFILALPDLNQIFKKLRSGRLLPTGFIKFLKYKNKINRARILILGVLREYRNQGIDLLLYKKIQDNCAELGIFHGEACYVMESNKKMNSILNKIGGEITKKYRIYKYDFN